jgi:hypothetical protein
MEPLSCKALTHKGHMKRPNEKNALEALIHIAPYLLGATFHLVCSPDDDNKNKEPQKEVDYILASEAATSRPLAVEHTIVESFKGQETYVIRSYNIIDRVNAMCSGQLPPQRYFFMILSHTLVETLQKDKQIERFVNSIAPWTIEASQRLAIDDCASTFYKGYEILLMCGGSHPTINGAVGRMPGRPHNHEDLARHSLWLSITHALAKFCKYKPGYDTILTLQNISGEVHCSMLSELMREKEKADIVNRLVDFIIVFDSKEDRMIFANVWKERQLVYKPVPPYTRRFDGTQGKWLPLKQ